MKPITDMEQYSASNAWGGWVVTYRQNFEVEESDIGRSIHHFGGYNYRTLTLTKRDVGKTMQQLTDGSDWQCWGFVNA